MSMAGKSILHDIPISLDVISRIDTLDLEGIE